jgi:hypothetical protein
MFQKVHLIGLNMNSEKLTSKKICSAAFRVGYEIIPSPLYGWNFKCVESRLVIRFSLNREELIHYAESYCKTHNSVLRIYNNFGEIEKSINFENDPV